MSDYEKNVKELSRSEWRGTQTREDINTGSLQRIADAVEKVAQNYGELLRKVAFYKTQNDELISDYTRLLRRTSSLRGVITKLKGKK